MYREISIANYRGFQNFHMRDLGRVNLLVGTNNSGKSTVLEAVELLASHGNPNLLWSITHRRGEQIRHDPDMGWGVEAAVAHLFHGHTSKLGSEFVISGKTASDNETCVSKIVERTTRDHIPAHELEYGDVALGPCVFLMEWRADHYISKSRLPFSTSGGLLPGFVPLSNPPRDDRLVRYVATGAMTVEVVAQLFDEIVLTDEEVVLIDALKTIDPTIERIASLTGGSRRSPSNWGSIVLKCKGVDQRIPIGTMGDGIWRMLGIAIALVTAKNGVLLVDEIDTGLHYSVMADMWRLVERTAERLNVQVFATTHSRDCYESLASIANESVTDESQVTIQRIERENGKTVAFSERDIVIAAQRGLEVR